MSELTDASIISCLLEEFHYWILWKQKGFEDWFIKLLENKTYIYGLFNEKQISLWLDVICMLCRLAFCLRVCKSFWTLILL